MPGSPDRTVGANAQPDLNPQGPPQGQGQTVSESVPISPDPVQGYPLTPGRAIVFGLTHPEPPADRWISYAPVQRRRRR